MPSELLSFWSELIGNTYVRAALITIVTTLIGRFLAARPILLWGVSHSWNYQIPTLIEDEPVLVIKTGQIWLNNWGRAPAKDVEILFNYLSHT